MKKKKYNDFETEYPEHLVIEHAGYFYSAYNSSAEVLANVMNYKLGTNYQGIKVTGGPSLDKIVATLLQEKIRFIVIEDGEIIEQSEGNNRFFNVRNFAQKQKNTVASNSHHVCNDSRSSRPPSDASLYELLCFYGLPFAVEIWGTKYYIESFSGERFYGRQIMGDVISDFESGFCKDQKGTIQKCDLSSLANSTYSKMWDGTSSGLPKREVKQFYLFSDKSLPQYIPGVSPVMVKRNGQWALAVFTGYKQTENGVVAYSVHNGEEKFVKYSADKLRSPTPEEMLNSTQLQKDIELVSGRATNHLTILNYLKSRNVKYLVHFTSVDNLESILRYGIVPRGYFNNDELKVSDANRYDNHLELSSFSLSFPNYKMLNSKRWLKSAILLIDIDALNSKDVDAVFFSPINAASGEIRRQGITNFCNLSDARNMFADELRNNGKVIQRSELCHCKRSLQNCIQLIELPD